MRYLANASNSTIRDAMIRGEIGQMCTPTERRYPLEGVYWAGDNACYGNSYPGDDTWFAWLGRLAALPGRASLCLFATAPDVVGDAVATLERSAPWLGRIRQLGLPAALVAQDGLEALTIPWDAFDVLFIGGSTEWKLSPAAACIAREAKARGKAVHMGRVNSGRRWAIAENLGCDSADGTFLAFGPDQNLRRMRAWMTPRSA